MAEFATTPPIPYVPIADKAAEVRLAIDAARLSAANSFGGLQKLAIPGPFATDAEANTGGVPDDNLYYRSDGTVRAASHISLDLAFALDKTLTARTGPTPTFSRASSGLFTNANGILVGKTAGTTASLDPTTTTVGTTEVTVTVASGSVVGWLVGQSVSLIVDTDGGNDNDVSELWLVGTIVSTTATQLVFTVTEKTITAGSQTAWTLGYRGARFDHDPATGASKGLLIEEPRSNLAFPSDMSSPWSVSRVTATPATDSPLGTYQILTVVDTTGAARLTRTVVVPSSQPYTISVFAKAGTISSFSFRALTDASSSVVFNLLNGTTSGSSQPGWSGQAQITPYPNGWYRCSMTYTPTALSQNYCVDLVYTGLGQTINFTGFQVEAGAFPTSYIPTTIGTAARSADVCSIDGTAFSSFYNQPEGSVIINGDSWNGTAPAWCSFNFGPAGNNRTFEFVRSGSNLIHSDSFAGNTIVKSSPTFPNKFGFIRGPANGFSSFGGAFGSSTSVPQLAAPNRLQIGLGVSSGVGYLNGCIKSLTYYRKQTSKLNTLTAP